MDRRDSSPPLVAQITPLEAKLMTTHIMVLGEALMDCISQPDGSLRPLIGGSPYNLARAASLQGASVTYLNPISGDVFGSQLKQQLVHDGVGLGDLSSPLPTSLAVVNVRNGQPSYGFYREGIADRDYTPAQIFDALAARTPGILHTGSLLLIPPESDKILTVLQGAKSMGWTLSVDVNMRPSVAPDLPRYVAAVKAVAALADWLKASDEDLETLGYAACTRARAPEMAAHFMRQGASRVALTFGGEGAYLAVGDQAAQANVPAITLADTVGAGDTFWGNCLALWADLSEQQARDGVTDTLTHAMLAAAINCTRHGCNPPTRGEVLAQQ
jgi:fructokinase